MIDWDMIGDMPLIVENCGPWDGSQSARWGIPWGKLWSGIETY